MTNTLHLPTPIQKTPDSNKEQESLANPPRGRNRSWRGLLVWILTVAIAFGGGWTLAEKAKSQREKDVLPPETGVLERDPESVVVTTAPVTYRPIERSVEGMGTLHGFEEVSLSAQVDGSVRKIDFDVADSVKPGQVLLEIDPTDYALKVQQSERALQAELAMLGLTEPPDAKFNLESVPAVMAAQVRMDNAKSKWERSERLVARGANTDAEHEQTTADYKAAKAEYANQVLVTKAALATIQTKQADLAVARQQLEHTQLVVPTPTRPVPNSAGSVFYAVTERSVAEGTFVQRGTEICKLAIIQTIKANVLLPGQYSSEVHLGQKAEVQTPTSPQPFTGTVTRINPAVDPKTRTFEIEVQLPNPEGNLKPGSFAKVKILTHEDAEAATVPLTAVIRFAGINKIFLADENGKAKEVHVTLGGQAADWIEITEPALPKGAKVITSGQSVLADETPFVERDANPETASESPANSRQEEVL